MMDYKKMYLALFNEVTDVIEQLQKAQQRTEEFYINTEDPIQLVKYRGQDSPDV